jgi:uncharacterized protein YoxC
VTKNKWHNMTIDEKLDALRQDIADISNFIDPLARDVRELSARLNEVSAKIDGLCKTSADSSRP